jgi:hypothetical protein
MKTKITGKINTPGVGFDGFESRRIIITRAETDKIYLTTGGISYSNSTNNIHQKRFNKKQERISNLLFLSIHYFFTDVSTILSEDLFQFSQLSLIRIVMDL